MRASANWSQLLFHHLEFCRVTCSLYMFGLFNYIPQKSLRNKEAFSAAWRSFMKIIRTGWYKADKTFGNRFLPKKICMKCWFKNLDKRVLLAPCLTGHLMWLSFSYVLGYYVTRQIKVTISCSVSWELAGVHSAALKSLKWAALH